MPTEDEMHVAFNKWANTDHTDGTDIYCPFDAWRACYAWITASQLASQPGLLGHLLTEDDRAVVSHMMDVLDKESDQQSHMGTEDGAVPTEPQADSEEKGGDR